MAFPQWLQQYEDLLKTAGLDSSITLPMLLYSVLLAPVCEELIFRGTTMHLARRALPFWLANTMQALLFGLFHMNWIQGIYAFALGLVLGYVCEKGGSIYYSILLHILFNLWGTVISTLLPMPSSDLSQPESSNVEYLRMQSVPPSLGQPPRGPSNRLYDC